jgi:hypothetical protein
MSCLFSCRHTAFLFLTHRLAKNGLGSGFSFALMAVLKGHPTLTHLECVGLISSETP